MASELNQRQQDFVVAYLTHGNATAAAIEAGYSEKTAHVIASNLLRNIKVKSKIAEETASRAMPAEEVIWRLSEQARADIGDLMDEDGFIDLAKAKRSKMTRHIRKIRQVQTTDGEMLNNAIELEIHDAQKALITLAKHYGLLIDRVQVSSGDVEDQIMAAVKRGELEYSVLQNELGDSLAADLFRRAGVPVDAAR
jgi:phage terminase small subunit